MRSLIAPCLGVLGVAQFICTGAISEELLKPTLNDITVYGGVMVEGDFPGDSLVPLGSPLTDVRYLSVAYNRDFLDLGAVNPLATGFHLGGELGLAGRFGHGDATAEFWFGPSLRYQGLSLGPVNLSFGVVGGLSIVNEPIGVEVDREQWSNGGSASLLFYAGPEFGLSLDAFPNTELVVRTHHRSGGKNISWLPTISEMGEASNTNTVGLRVKF